MSDQSPASWGPLNWDDLRLVLTIARCGSLNGAAAQLEINVSTASRRLNQIEAALNILCFVRRPSGIEPTPAGQLVVDHAAEIERQTIKLRRATMGEQIAASAATITITATDSLGIALVIPFLAELLADAKALSVNLVTDNRMLDLHRGEADLALRLRRPDTGGLKIRKIAEMSYGLYAAPHYIERAGMAVEVEDLRDHTMIGLRSAYPNHPPSNRFEELCRIGKISMRTDRTQERLAGAEGGLGITMLPIAIGARTNLLRVLPNIGLPALEVFLLAEPGALRVREVRQVAEQLADFAKRNAASLKEH